MDYEKVKEEIKKKYLETNENEISMVQNLWDTAKALLRGTFIAIQSYLNKKNLQQPNVTAKTTRKRTKQNLKLVEGKKS